MFINSAGFPESLDRKASEVVCDGIVSVKMAIMPP
jgi:hypothetical protein